MKALILAAGFGKRLGKLTLETPKCLVDVAGKPIIEHVMRHLMNFGINSFVVNTHYLADQVVNFLKNAPFLAGIDVKILHEKIILGTGGGIKNAESLLVDDDFIVHNADIYEEFDLSALIKTHQSSKALSTLAIVDKKTDSCILSDSQSNFGGLWREGASTIPLDFMPFTFTGVQCISPKIFTYMKNFSGEFPIFPVYAAALENHEIIKTHYQNKSFHLDMGTPVDLTILRKRLACKCNRSHPL